MEPGPWSRAHFIFSEAIQMEEGKGEKQETQINGESEPKELTSNLLVQISLIFIHIAKKFMS